MRSAASATGAVTRPDSPPTGRSAGASPWPWPAGAGWWNSGACPDLRCRDSGRWSGALLVPPAGAIATELIPNARKAGTTAALAAAGIGVTNALAEEALWRGVPLAVFPGRQVRGWLWPSLGFIAWHLVPLSVRPHPRGRWPVLLGAGLIGLGYGWAAQKTGSLLAVSMAHAATDSCGVRAARTIWLPSDSGQKPRPFPPWRENNRAGD